MKNEFIWCKCGHHYNEETFNECPSCDYAMTRKEEEHIMMMNKGYVLTNETCHECEEGLLYANGRYADKCNNHECITIFTRTKR